MTEIPKAFPIEAYDIADLSQERREFAGNTTALYNAMVLYDLNGGVEYLGKLHGFDTFYDGIILSVGHPEMEEKDAKALRDVVLGENIQGYEFGNPLGTPVQRLVKQGTVIEEMWSVPVEFINRLDHFMNSPDEVFDSLDELAKRLHAYKTKVSGFDQMGVNESTRRNLRGLRALDSDTRRLEIHRPNIPDIVLEDGEEDIPLPDNKVSDQQVTKRPNPFSRFLNKLGRKTS